MEKFRNFIYDKNDIIVTLVILIIAVLIIYFRIHAIMNYPDTLVDTYAAPETQTAQPAETAPAVTDQQAAAAANAATEKNLTIAEENTSASTVAQALVDIGMVDSAAKFEKMLADYQLTTEIKPGSYSLPVDLTEKQIIEIITQTTIEE